MAENTNTQVTVTEENKEVAKQSNNKVTDYSLGLFGTSDNFIMACQMAKALALSTLVPQIYRNNESNCLIAIDLSQRLGASPFLVMQNLDIIQGKPSWSAKALIGMINASNKYDFELQFEEKTDSKGKPFSCQCWTERKGRKVTGPIIDMDMANAEGWVNKNGSKWKTMPQVMLRYRAASFFSRMNCPEISMGIYTTDEIIDGDFKEYSLNDVQEDVKHDIEVNANTIPFEDADEEVIKAEVVEVEEDTEQELPDFMSAE